jgi:hypothetical protein
VTDRSASGDGVGTVSRKRVILDLGGDTPGTTEEALGRGWRLVDLGKAGIGIGYNGYKHLRPSGFGFSRRKVDLDTALVSASPRPGMLSGDDPRVCLTQRRSENRASVRVSTNNI